MKKISNEEFKILVESIKGTYLIFCFNKIGHIEIGKELNRKPWEDFKDVWSYILVSLRFYYSVNLAKIFDREYFYDNIKKVEKFNISFCRIIPDYKNKFSKKSLETIEKVKNIRNEILVHQDAMAMLSNKNCEEHYELDFKGNMIEGLFIEIFEFLNEIKEDYGYMEEINQEKEKEKIQERFNEWYKVFREKYI